jgi:predicted  nucleic acid-binding Zn-ribbon protein
VSEDLDHLIALQQLDTDAENARRLVAATPQRMEALDAQLAGAQSAVTAARERKMQNDTERRGLEKDVAAVRARRSKFLDQTIEVKTNKEFHALQHEIQMAEEEIGRIEDRILENMVAADELTADMKSAEAALKDAERTVAAQKQTLERERRDAEESLGVIARDRDALVSRTSPEAVSLFERITRGKKGHAVAEIQGDLCSVCHVRVRPQIDQEVRRREHIVLCENCGRILYYVRRPAPSPEPAP